MKPHEERLFAYFHKHILASSSWYDVTYNGPFILDDVELHYNPQMTTRRYRCFDIVKNKTMIATLKLRWAYPLKVKIVVYHHDDYLQLSLIADGTQL